MPLLCYLCKNKKATYIFPRDDARKKVWIDSLQLECEPPKHARLCSEHFLESDFHVRGGKKYLVSESIPTRSVKCKSYLADHNYALGMEYQDASFPPEIFVLSTIGLLLLSDFFLLSFLSQSTFSYSEGTLTYTFTHTHIFYT